MWWQCCWPALTSALPEEWPCASFRAPAWQQVALWPVASMSTATTFGPWELVGFRLLLLSVKTVRGGEGLSCT